VAKASLIDSTKEIVLVEEGPSLPCSDRLDRLDKDVDSDNIVGL
jgi:hypothetical protein